MATVFDPLRQKHVALTPEEGVRQWFVGLLLEHYGVEKWRMASEYTVKVGARRLRADVVVFAPRTTQVRAVVECKAPSVDIDQSTLDQALTYCSLLGAQLYIVTNGTTTLAWDMGAHKALETLEGVL